jgi:hypothetical protein
MKETSIYDYYSFGYNYYILRVNWDKKTKTEALSDLETYLANVSKLELQVTSHVVSGLRGSVESLKKLKAEDAIPGSISEYIQQTIEGADKTLDAELQIKKVLSITPKRFDIEKLLRSPEELLASGCWECISETAKRDFASATRCIAMNLATAAAFHQMRCVEECVKLLYLHFVKNGRMEKPMWGPMVEKLRIKNKPRPKSELLDQLDIIRANFRNPTQHPQKFYSIDEAQDLLNSSIVAIGGICREISPLVKS